MMEAMPEKLFVCMFKVKSYYSKNVEKLRTEHKPLPQKLKAIRDQRVQFTKDISEKGLLWMGGPAIDAQLSMNVLAVNSIEEAKKVQRADPGFISGLFYDDKYFQWDLHIAFSKVSPKLKERGKQTAPPSSI